VTAATAEVSPRSVCAIAVGGRRVGAAEVSGGGARYVGGKPGGVYWVPVSAYSLFRECGDRAKTGTGDCADVDRGWARRFTGGRGEAAEEVEVRREAW
jgi:hypothetical protein